MARTDNFNNFLTDVANAIRNKEGTTEKIAASEFDARINNITSSTEEIELQEKEVTPTKEIQTITSDEDYDGLNKVVVNPIPDEYIIPDGTLNVDANGDVDVTMFRMARVGVYTPPTLQDKEITPTKEVQTVVASEGYDGLSGVTVNAIPDEYVVPSGELEITENGTYNVREYASTNINVPTGGALPDIGFVVDSFDSDGYAKKLTIVGMTSLPAYAFAGYVSGSAYYISILTKKLEEIVLPEVITEIPTYCCYSCQELTKINLSQITSIGSNAFLGTKLTIAELPANLKTLGASAFKGCTGTTFKTIPDGVTTLNQTTFYGNTGLTQISMSKVKSMTGSSSSNGTFCNCSNLKAVWIGSAIGNGTKIGRYPFYGCTNLQKLYIDLPRATIEEYQYYSNAFTGGQKTTDIIICNDDADFITKEAFDATTF